MATTRLLAGGLSALLACCTAAPPPAAVDLRPQFAAFGLQPRAQGNRPTCSVFTVTAAYEFALGVATGSGQRLSVEYLNWAANAATGRTDDGDFFHCILAGAARFGVCPEAAMPYAPAFAPEARPNADALIAGGRMLATTGERLLVRWIRPWQPGGLTEAQFDDVRRTLARGWPVAAGANHSRLLVGYRDDAAQPGGGCCLTLDSGSGSYAEVDYAFVRTQLNDAFAIEVR